MNEINRKPLNTLGYDFIPAPYLPKGKDEYYLRNKQNKNGIHYRHLSAYEIEVLVRNRNTSDNWITCWYQTPSIRSWCRTANSLDSCALASWNLITWNTTTCAAR
jgi:hypothetical protein